MRAYYADELVVRPSFPKQMTKPPGFRVSSFRPSGELHLNITSRVQMLQFAGALCEQNASQQSASANKLVVTYTQARQRLQSVRSCLSRAIQDYLAACQFLVTTYNTLTAPSAERKQTLLAIDSELSTFATEETSIRQARNVLTGILNKSKMVAPVYKLPREILAQIFSEAACRCPLFRNMESVQPILSPHLICGVCREWRHVAFNHLTLWTHVDLVVGAPSSNQRYPSAQLWSRLSQGAPLYLNIRQYRSHDEGTDYRLPLYDKYHPAPIVFPLRDFLIPLMRQICSINLVLGSPMDYLLGLLLDWWSTHGTYGQAKMLLMQSEREQPSLKVEGLGLHPAMTEYGRRYTNFLRNLETLVFRNAMPAGWSSWSYNKIVLLVLEAGDEKWSMTQTELASVLASCPRLQYLWLDNLEIRCSDEFMPPPVALNELRLLDVQAYDVKRMTESVLAILVPGPHPLRLNISIPWFPNSHIDTLAAVQLFVSQYNVTTLYIANYEDGPCFASQLGPFPRIKTLVLHVIHFSDTAWTEHQGSRATYASPDQASSVLWPDLRNLYLEECVLQKDHIRRLLSVHSVQALYMRKCYNGVAFREEFLMRSQDSEEFAQSLSDIVPKSVHFKEGWTQWPISSRFESW